MLSMRHIDAWLLAGILVLGFALRFYNLAHVPPGLWYDEAFYADEAVNFLNGNPRLIYYMRDESQIGLFPALMAIGLWLFGDHLYALRATIACWGFLGLIGCYFLCLELFIHSPQKKAIALGAMFLLATSYWHLNYSRLLFSCSLVPTIEICSVWLTLRAFHEKESSTAAMAAVVTALGFYSYWPYYPFVLLPASIVLYRLYEERRQATKIFIVYIIAGVAASLPMIMAFMDHDLTGRLRAERAFDMKDLNGIEPVYHALMQIVYNAGMYVRMLFVEGDKNWRHNLSGQPALSIPAAIGLCLAVCIMIRNFMTKTQMRPLLLLMMWLAVALLPAVLSKPGAHPHASRSIGMLVPCQILAAFGYVTVWQYIEKKWGAHAIRRYGFSVLVSACIIQTALVVKQYFITFAKSPVAKAEFILLENAFLRHQFAREAQ